MTMRRAVRRSALAGLALSSLVVAGSPSTASAQDAWVPDPPDYDRRPARSREPAPPVDDRPLLAPMDGPRPGFDGTRRAGARGADGADGVGQSADRASRAATDAVGRDALPPAPPVEERSRAVERGDLSPVIASDGSGLPHELWRGLDVAAVERLMAGLELPPRSPALAALWRRLVTADVPPPSGSGADSSFAALRIEALMRSGRLAEATAAVEKLPRAAADPRLTVLVARSEIALGRRDQGCEAIRAGAGPAALPKDLKADAILISGYCAVSGGNTAAAGLAAELAREHGVETGAGLAVLDAIAAGTEPDLTAAKRLGTLDYRLLEAAGRPATAELVEKSTPAVAVLVARDTKADPLVRIAAAEAAVRWNALSAADLADIYRAHPDQPPADVLQQTDPGRRGLRRALLLKAAEGERTPMRKVRIIRAFLDDARRAGLYLPALEMMAPVADSLAPVAEIGWFAETAIETQLAAGRNDRARVWADFARTSGAPRGGLDHWLALADIATSAPGPGGTRGETLASVETLALQGSFGADVLHRLATVLDALDYNVPIPLWEAASRAPQPTGGHLPETGVLTELADASKKKEFGHTVLVAMKTLGPDGAEGANIIALGDAIRALKRAGLEADARRLGFEALFASWPRTATN